MKLGWSVGVGREKRAIVDHYACPACCALAHQPCTSLHNGVRNGKPIQGVHAARLVAAGFDRPERYISGPLPDKCLRPSARELYEELERARRQLEQR